MTKYVFITGGVVSGLGKGIVTASLGRLLKACGYKVAAQKLDPYINVDPGTMNPCQHGEVFVTEDGAETDLDLGHYERFIDEDLNKLSNLTTGKVYREVIERERRGEYLGETVQIIPHVTGAIKEYVYAVGKKTGADIVLTEIGGTIGDIESQPFLEAARQIGREVGRENRLFVHVTLVPYIACSGEQKTKPTQHSVKELRQMGISPDIIVTRQELPLGEGARSKIALFCDVKPDCIIEDMTVGSIYEAPVMLERGGLSAVAARELGLPAREPDLSDWTAMLERAASPSGKVRIALVGKYVEMRDAYLSVAEAIRHGGFENAVGTEIEWIEAEDVTSESAERLLSGADGILVPGGFGERGVEGKIAAAKFARERDIPYLGICLGMQTAVIEFARDEAGIADACSGEFSAAGSKVIDLMPDQHGDIPKGGTMRLGAYECVLKEGGLLREIYGAESVRERHRHRYEFNNHFRAALEGKGLSFEGLSPDGRLVEAVSVPGRKFFVGVQFHPEFKSRPNKAHPLFLAFVKAAAERAEERKR